MIRTMPTGLLSQQQKQDFHECFSMLDTDKTGRVSMDNLLAALHVLDVEVPFLCCNGLSLIAAF